MYDAWIAWCAVGIMFAWSIWRDVRGEGQSRGPDRLTTTPPLALTGTCTLELLDGNGTPLGITRSTAGGPPHHLQRA